MESHVSRLKECRKREDEIADPPGQEPPDSGVVAGRYPRIWVQTAREADGPRFVFVQPYDGATLRIHAWLKDAYECRVEPHLLPERLAMTPLYRELTDDADRAGVWNRVMTALPLGSNN